MIPLAATLLIYVITVHSEAMRNYFAIGCPLIAVAVIQTLWVVAKRRRVCPRCGSNFEQLRGELVPEEGKRAFWDIWDIWDKCPRCGISFDEPWP